MRKVWNALSIPISNNTHFHLPIYIPVTTYKRNKFDIEEIITRKSYNIAIMRGMKLNALHNKS